MNLSWRKGESVSFFFKYIGWHIIFSLAIGGIAAILFVASLYGVIDISSRAFKDAPLAGPDSGLAVFFIILIFIAMIVGIAMTILYLLVAPILFGGLARVGDRFIDGKPVRFMDFWVEGKRDYWRTFGIFFLMGLATSMIINILTSPVNSIAMWFKPWWDVIFFPIRIFTYGLLMIVVMTPLIIEHRSGKDLVGSIKSSFKVFIEYWKVLLELVLLITFVVSPPLMILMAAGIIVFSSTGIALLIGIPVSFVILIFISLFINHLIRSRSDLID